jgi:hypothetical protein
VEDALVFLENHTHLDNAHVKLLIDLGRILEAARIHARNGDMLKAVEVLTPFAHSADHVRPMIEYLLTGLRRGLIFGAIPKSGFIASKLLALADLLEKSAMTEQEIEEVSPSHSFDRWFYILVPPACNV